MLIVGSSPKVGLVVVRGFKSWWRIVISALNLRFIESQNLGRMSVLDIRYLVKRGEFDISTRVDVCSGRPLSL